MMIQRSHDAARRGVSALALRGIFPELRRQFGTESPFLVLPATGCMELAADPVERHRLRGVDSVQLAAALHASRLATDAEAFLFVSDDEAQVQSGRRRGLEVLRPAA